MRLWTIQSAEAYRHLIDSGRLAADERYIFSDFIKAYQWMSAKLEALCTAPKGINYPIWAWYQWEGKCRKRVDKEFANKGDRLIQLTIEIDNAQVLLSDFDLFHFVLNNWYLPVDEADDLRFEGLDFNNQKLKDEYIRQSWDRIFDITKEDDGWLYGKNSCKSIQAVFWQLTQENIIEVEEYAA